MQNTVQSVLENVERFLRWLYPGLLLLGLLHLGRNEDLVETLNLQDLSSTAQGFALVGAVVVLGVLVYDLQRYVVHELLFQWFFSFFLLRAGASYNYARNQGELYTKGRWWQCWCRLSPSRFMRASAKLSLASNAVADGKYRHNRAYDWSVTHAMGLSAWLVLLAAFFAQTESVLDDLHPWVLVTGALLGVAWLWQEARNTFPRVWADLNEVRWLMR